MSVYIRVELQRRVRTFLGNCCADCHTAEFLTAMTFEIEHIIPLSVGGQTVFEHLCFACPTCNRHKGDRQTVIDPETGAAVGLFHPHNQVWAEHFTWSDGGKEISGLTTVGRATIMALQMNRPTLIRARAMWVNVSSMDKNT